MVIKYTEIIDQITKITKICLGFFNSSNTILIRGQLMNVENKIKLSSTNINVNFPNETSLN